MSRLEERLKKSYQEEMNKEEVENFFEPEESYQKPSTVAEITNPHSLYKDIVTNPSPKGKFKMTLRGRPVDLADLENYLVFKISPKTITTVMRYSDAKTLAELAFGRKKKLSKLNIGWLLTTMTILLIIGFIMLTQGGNLVRMFSGLFGG